jgi:hypothetical protein
MKENPSIKINTRQMRTQADTTQSKKIKRKQSTKQNSGKNPSMQRRLMTT